MPKSSAINAGTFDSATPSPNNSSPTPAAPAEQEAERAAAEVEQEAEQEPGQNLPPGPPVPPRTPSEPSEAGSLKSELRELRELAQVHHNLVQSLIQQMSQMRDLFNQALERLTAQSQEHAATLDLWQDHVATQEEWIERLEDVTAAHIRMLQDQSASE